VTDRRYDAVVVGAGSAGMAAALRMRTRGLSVAVVEREDHLGGILIQCIHNGFGLHRFRADLTGPEYADRFIQPLIAAGIDAYLDATVLSIAAEADGKRTVTVCSSRYGVLRLSAGAVVLAMGCRERNRGNVGISGTRPAGVFTAGLAQRLVNIEGWLPGRRAVIVGSGDIGLIMARRLTLAGCEVLCVVEIQPYPSGIVRNIVQCLNDFSIPLHLGHVITRIRGRQRVEGVEVAPLADGAPDLSRLFALECDTVLLSVGLVPENEISARAGVRINRATGGPYVDADHMTSVDGLYACGNVLHVHDLVDYVTEEAESTGESVARRLGGAPAGPAQQRVAAGANVRYVVPNSWVPGRANDFFLRSLVVKNDAELSVSVDGREVSSRRLSHVQPSEMIRLSLTPGDLSPAREGQANLMEVSLR